MKLFFGGYRCLVKWSFFFSVLLPLSVAVTVINKSPVLSIPLGQAVQVVPGPSPAGCVRATDTPKMLCDPWVFLIDGVCCRAELPEASATWAMACEILPQLPWELMSFKYMLPWACIFLCSCLSSISKCHRGVLKSPKQTPGTKPVFWLRIFAQTNGSKSVLIHIGCNSLNNNNSLLMSYTYAQMKAMDKPVRDLRCPTAQLQQHQAHHFVC